jgi:Uma2 family endonuclease
MQPMPAVSHVRAGSSLGVVIAGPYDHGPGGPGGWWILDEPELHLGIDVLVPDLAGWRKIRMPHRPDTACVALSPDWICQILSPSTAVVYGARKAAIYAREAVAHAWLIDPELQTLEVLQLEGGRAHGGLT